MDKQQDMDKQQYIEAGRIVNTHGVNGEVKIEVWLDSPQFMKKCGRIFVGGNPVRILSGREHKGFLLARLEGVDDVNAAMCLKGKNVFIDRSDAKLPRGAVFHAVYFNYPFFRSAAYDAFVGTLAEIMETPASMIYVIRGEAEHLIPAVPEFILNTDAEAGVITVHMIEGM